MMASNQEVAHSPDNPQCRIEPMPLPSLKQSGSHTLLLEQEALLPVSSLPPTRHTSDLFGILSLLICPISTFYVFFSSWHICQLITGGTNRPATGLALCNLR